MDCPNCGEAVREGARFCGACGNAVPAGDAVGPQKGPSLPPLMPSPPPITVTQDVGLAAPGPPPPPQGAPAPQPASSNTPWVVAAVAAVVVMLVVVGAAVLAATGGDDSQQTATIGPEANADGSPVTTALPATTTVPSTTSPPTTAANPEDAARQELEDWVARDERRVDAEFVDTWLPQLSAKQLGVFDERTGVSYPTYVSILDHFRELERTYGDVVLVDSTDYVSFEFDGYYVMLVAGTFGSDQAVLDWCAGHGLDNDFCYAKMPSRTNGDFDATTTHP